jgi:hypothetical protein
MSVEVISPEDETTNVGVPGWAAANVSVASSTCSASRVTVGTGSVGGSASTSAGLTTTVVSDAVCRGMIAVSSTCAGMPAGRAVPRASRSGSIAGADSRSYRCHRRVSTAVAIRGIASSAASP